VLAKWKLTALVQKTWKLAPACLCMQGYRAAGPHIARAVASSGGIELRAGCERCYKSLTTYILLFPNFHLRGLL